MNIRDIMTSGVAFCTPETNLAAAAASMWQHDCGVLPVVDEKMRVQGMITDRDICIALGTRNRPAADISVAEVSKGTLYACRIDDDIQSVLSTMRDHKVRRVPIVDPEGALAGIVSIDDIALLARDGKGSGSSGITYTDAVETQKSIVARPLIFTPTEKIGRKAPAAEPAPVHVGDFDFEE